MSQEFYRYHTDREIEEAFRFFDVNGIGSIATHGLIIFFFINFHILHFFYFTEFAKAIRRIRVNLTEEEIQEICSKIDTNKDNRISLEGNLIFCYFHAIHKYRDQLN
jgi:Ca2+-binding EF-hand superfamily protein